MCTRCERALITQEIMREKMRNAIQRNHLKGTVSAIFSNTLESKKITFASMET